MVKSIDELQEITARRRIEPRHGFIEYQDLGLHSKHAGKRQRAAAARPRAQRALVAHRGQVGPTRASDDSTRRATSACDKPRLCGPNATSCTTVSANS